MWDVVITTLVVLAVAKASHWLYRWQNPNCNGKLPPGDMGFPFVGKVFELFKPHGLHEVMPFIKNQMQRYGTLSRTNLLGFKTIVSTDPEINYEIFRQEDKAFVIGYPQVNQMFGESSLFFKQGNFHKYIKNVTLRLLGIEGLRKRLIHEMDNATLERLEAAAGNGIIDFQKLVQETIFGIMHKNVLQNMPPEVKKEIQRFQDTFGSDFFRMAFSIAWRSLWKCIAGRKKGAEMIKDVIRKRRASKTKHGDFLDTLIEEMEKENTIMNEETVIQVIFILPMVATDSISKVMPLALKFITENRTVIEELKREHEGILQNRADKEAGLTWEEYKAMAFTQMVLNESQRLASSAPFMLRKAIKDVEFKGYIIPAGWHVLIAPGVTHFDPKIYNDPLSFNPWRWENPNMNLEMGKHLMVFGGGARLCAGAQFTKLQMAIFLHHLVTKFRWNVTGGSEVFRAPTIKFTNGLHIQLSRNYE